MDGYTMPGLRKYSIWAKYYYLQEFFLTAQQIFWKKKLFCFLCHSDILIEILSLWQIFTLTFFYIYKWSVCSLFSVHLNEFDILSATYKYIYNYLWYNFFHAGLVSCLPCKNIVIKVHILLILYVMNMHLEMHSSI